MGALPYMHIDTPKIVSSMDHLITSCFLAKVDCFQQLCSKVKYTYILMTSPAIFSLCVQVLAAAVQGKVPRGGSPLAEALVRASLDRPMEQRHHSQRVFTVGAPLLPGKLTHTLILVLTAMLTSTST